MAKLIGKRYAEALYEVALELDKLEQFKDEIKAISQVLESEPKLKTIFEHPKLSKDEKKDIINSIFKGRVSQEILNLCYIVIDKGRETNLSDICEEYTKLSNIKQGIVEATAITAVPMQNKEMKKLEKQLSMKLDKKVLLSNVIDSTIIGGVLVKIGDKVIDASVKGKFEELYKDLNNVRVRIG
ncbi:F0F1 ATP synthase subunit delta [Proteiniborus sp.]|uniref:F0F1 ATP synthase subunit delta n=1 Tax=Proteiniborus sp. TaxID=2079015 RepID=UPI00332F9167